MNPLLHLFFTAKESRWWLVLLALFAASLAESIGLMSLVPLLAVAVGPEEQAGSEATEMVREVFERLAIPLELGPLIALVVGLSVLSSVLRGLALRYVGNASADISNGYRQRIIRNLFDVRWSFLVWNPVGRIANSVATECTKVGSGYTAAAEFLSLALQTLVLIIVGFTISWRIALAAIGIGALVTLALHGFVGTSRKAGKQQNKHLRELMTYLNETLSNVKPLKAMGRDRAFATVLERRIRGVRKAVRRQVLSAEVLKNGSNILVALSLGAGLYFALAIWQVALIELVVIGAILKRIINALSKAQVHWQTLAALEAPYAAVQRLIDETDLAREVIGSRQPAQFERECRFVDVSFAYGEHKVLHDVSLEIPGGTMTVLIGSSGSGKTTLIDLIVGLYAPDSGQILIDDRPLSGLDLRSWRQLIGYVPQELVLFHDTVFANVALGDERVGEVEVRAALEMAGAWDFVSRMPKGIDSIVGERGAKLSGGQRQRIALARALAVKPKLLILDEVTSALDPATELEICQSLRKLLGDMAILAITHRPGFLNVADRVYQVHAGRVTEMTGDRLPLLELVR